MLSWLFITAIRVLMRLLLPYPVLPKMAVRFGQRFEASKLISTSGGVYASEAPYWRRPILKGLLPSVSLGILAATMLRSSAPLGAKTLASMSEGTFLMPATNPLVARSISPRSVRS